MFLQIVKFSVKKNILGRPVGEIFCKKWTDGQTYIILLHGFLRNSIPGFSRYSKLASVHVLSKKLG